MKLYIVVRNDLSPGAQMAQSVHAFREFVENHPETEENWYRTSNTIVILGADDEKHLKRLMRRGTNIGLRASAFFEPDFDNELTAVVFEPGEKTSEFLRDLRLAGSFTGTG